MVNKVILIGNLGKDPELTYTQAGVPVCKTSLATTERFKGRDGEKKEQTEWHNLVFWRGLAEVADKYLRKGSKIYIEGRIKYRSWDDKDGNKKYMTDIEVQQMQMLGGRGDGGSGGGQGGSGGGQGGWKPADTGDYTYEKTEPKPGGGDFGSSKDDDLPF